MYSNFITYFFLFILCIFFLIKGWHQLWPDSSTLFFCIAVFPNCSEHLHPDFSMQNKLLKVTDRSYSHQKPPKLYMSSYEQQTYRKNALNPSSNPQTCSSSTASPRSPARLQPAAIGWERKLRMPGCQNTEGCCLSPCAAAVDLKLVKVILRHLWILNSKCIWTSTWFLVI